MKKKWRKNINKNKKNKSRRTREETIFRRIKKKEYFKKNWNFFKNIRRKS